MGLIQNKVTVSQPNSHVVVKNAGGLRGLTGETGPQGPQGVPGEAATVTAGTTTTLPAGSNATVQNVGSTSAAIFNFGIPKGDKGDTGETGAAATISVGTTTTLEPGEDATVTNSGTSSAAVFDFGIPKGAKGDTGATGADGYSPSATVTKTGDTATITITDKDGTTTASISDGTTPTVNDGTLTIQKNGTTVQTFSADQASNVTANITVPTQFSELSGTVSSSQIEDEAITTGSVSGTGTNITLAGTMEGGAIESVEMYGDTEQTTYSGKNKYNATKASSTTNTVTTSADIGQLYVNGTTSTDFGIEFGYTSLPAGTYTFCLELVSGSITSSSTGGLFNFRGDNITLVSCPISNSTKKNSVQVTVSANTTNARIQLWCRTTETFTNAVVKYQLVSGSTADYDFEPYVGGTASPNPDYPQNVNVVTGEQNVNIRSKNILDKTTLEQGTFNYLTGADSEDSNRLRTQKIACIPNTTYTASANRSLSECAVVYYAQDGTTIIPGDGAATGNSYYTFTTPAGAYYMRARFGSQWNAMTLGNEYNLQIEMGSSVTSYEQYYGDVTKTVNLGKNLFNKGNFPSVDGFIRADNYTLTSSASNKTTYIKANPNTTYTFSGFALGVALVVGTFNKVPALGDVANVRVLKGASDTTVNITTGASDSYIAFMYQTSSDTLDTSAFQIEKGSTATTYAPYFTPIELCKIGTYQDYIYKSGEDWYVHKETGKVTFTGAVTETWSSATAATGYARFSTASGETHADNNGYCNEFINRGSQSHGAYEYVWVQPNANAFYIQVLNTRANDLAGFRTWLGANPATVYYDISTPTDTQITNATLISELEDLLSATTYSGTTYITVSGDLASPLEVVAESDSKLAPDSVYGAAIKDGAVSVDKIADLKALADALAPYLNS